jgi:hydroxymethylglutaryl-CoA synthase
MTTNGNGTAPSSVAIVGVGAAVPANRLAVSEIAAGWDQGGGKGTLAVCGPDEDTLTLAWSAAGRALEAAGLSSAEIGGLWWGTARPPMAEGPSHAFLASTLGMDAAAAGLLAAGSVHAGMDALVAAWDAVVAGSVETALVVASDALVPGPRTGTERETGAGAVAFVLAAGRGEPARLVTRITRSAPLLDRYRGDGDAATGDPYDPRLFRERELLPSVRGAADALRVVGQVPEDARWSLPDPDGRLGRVVARSVGAGNVVSDGVHARVGETGAAAPFLGAVAGMTDAGPLVVVGTGGGRTTAVLVDVSGPVPGAAAALEATVGEAAVTRAVSYAAVLRARGQLVPLAEPVAMGVPPGSAAFVRGNVEMLGLTGRRCEGCGTIAVPPSIHPVCPGCGAEGGVVVNVAREGRVQTFVVNHTMPPPFEAPLPMVVVDLVDGARVLLQGMPEDAADLAIGDRVALELRRYAVERGVPVYGYKVRRTADAAEPAGTAAALA